VSRDPALARLIAYWETLTPATVGALGEFYAVDAKFQDPFNAVQGLPAITRIFHDMFERLHEPRFHVRQSVQEGRDVFLIWDFTFRIKSLSPERVRTIHGTSHLQLADDGRVIRHRDYWDAAAELYAQLPVIGGLMRFLARRFA
jgi:hypothetical protein